VVELDHGVVRPEPPADFFARDDLPIRINKHSQDLQRLLRQQQDSPVTLTQFSGSEINLKHSDANTKG